MGKKKLYFFLNKTLNELNVSKICKILIKWTVYYSTDVKYNYFNKFAYLAPGCGRCCCWPSKNLQTPMLQLSPLQSDFFVVLFFFYVFLCCGNCNLPNCLSS